MFSDTIKNYTPTYKTIFDLKLNKVQRNNFQVYFFGPSTWL